jgi:uncharacterized protein YuzE
MMKFAYDQTVDALYITLTDKPHVRTKSITTDFMLDLDEAGQVIGIEVLNVRKSGIDPLTLILEQHISDEGVERPDQDDIKTGHAMRMETLKRKQTIKTDEG